MTTFSFEISSSETAKIRAVLKALGAKKIKVEQDDSSMSKEDFLKKMDCSLQDIKDGKGTLIKDKQELKQFFDSL